MWPFTRNHPTPGKQLRQIQIDRERQIVRAKVDEMRARLGMPPINWTTMKEEY